MSRLATGILALSLAFGLVAGCGDDEDEAGGADFCELAREFYEMDDMPSDEQMDSYVDAAPDEIADEARLAIAAFKENGEDAYEDEEVVAAVTKIEEFEAEECGIERPGDE